MTELALYIYIAALLLTISVIYILITRRRRELGHDGLRYYIAALYSFSVMCITNFAVTYIFSAGYIEDTRFPETLMPMLYAVYTGAAAFYYIFITLSCFCLTGKKAPAVMIILLVVFQALSLLTSVLQLKYPEYAGWISRIITIRKLDLYSRIYLTGIYFLTLLRSRRISDGSQRKAVLVFASVFIIIELLNFLHHDFFPGWYRGRIRALTNSLSFLIPAVVIAAGIKAFLKLYFGKIAYSMPPAATELNERERIIIDRICSGKSNKEIAYEMELSLSNVKYHTHRIYKKLGVANRVELCNLIRAEAPRI